MTIQRHFLVPTQPALLAAAKFLLSEMLEGTASSSPGLEADLSGMIVVVPGARAGQRLLELLVDQAEELGRALIPPRIVTVGLVPELLYHAKLDFAVDLAQRLAWYQALRETPSATLDALTARLPDKEDQEGWLELADVLCRQHVELAANAMDFAHVAHATEQLDQPEESQRWLALHAIQKTYLAKLDKVQRWDRQTARLIAIHKRECATDKRIVLVGTVDLPQAIRQMIEQVADHVTALIHAPQEWADRFDDLGCLISGAWTDTPIDLATEQLVLASDPLDQADAVARAIARYDGRYRSDEIIVGVPDGSIVPQIERQLRQCEIPCRWGTGRAISETGPFRLLASIARLLEGWRFQDFAALVRHPDVYDWLQGKLGPHEDWLTKLDKYQGARLPIRLGYGAVQSLETASAEDAVDDFQNQETIAKTVYKVYNEVARWLEPLSQSQKKASPGDWTDPILAVLATIYGHLEADPNDPTHRATLAACRHLQAALLEHREDVPASLTRNVAISAAGAIRLALNAIRSNVVAPAADVDAIELLGWLELPLDDAPALIVTSLNEGYVPKSVNSDLFLPNVLRVELGLEDNTRRYARDAYALSILVASKSDLTLIVGQRTGEGEPLAPSRLLFATDRETIARRSLLLFDDAEDDTAKPPFAGALVASRDTSDFPYLMPEPLTEPITKLSPTAFRAYLACPYRFYLKRVLRLDTMEDDARELDGAAFGNLIHGVLKQFGESDHRDATQPATIQKLLREILQEEARQAYGTHPLAPVRVQIEQAGLRLDAFAEAQAAWANQGWQIRHVEADTEVPFVVDDKPITLHGRIDRIDYHPALDQWAVLDYKSSDSAKKPEQAHQKGGEWIDLQLPLYRHMAQSLGVSGTVRLGYVSLPKSETGIEFCLAEWNQADLAIADTVAQRIVRQIRNEIFWPPTDPPPPYSEHLAPICQDGVFDRPSYEE